MKQLINLSPAWTETLGWTLLNSLWQAFIIFTAVILLLRLIPTASSKFRYAITCIAMALFILTSAGTFIYLLDTNDAVGAAEKISFYSPSPFLNEEHTQSLPIEKFLAVVQAVITANMSFFVWCWIAGTILFSLRMISGWWYISKLRAEAIVLNDHWNNTVKTFAAQLGIEHAIMLAQSTSIHAPIVLGYLKPMILIPAGMISGLSTQQIETIFIHELAHIKRHDYLVNLIQSFVETIFFFNPFVWMMSNLIRREREYCCDDEVVNRYGSALAYAQALAHLEEVRLSKPAFALSLAENKNQLLNRIKRIMEKSANNYSGREKVIPAALIIIGLVCASWLTIGTDHIQEGTRDETKIAADTVDKKKTKSARYSKKVVTTYDEKGKPHEEVVEDFEGNEELRALMPELAFDFHMPQSPVFPMGFPDTPALPGAPGVPDFQAMIPPFAPFRLDGDSIPARTFRYRTEKDWEEFSNEFEKRFRERFGDFYKSHEKDIEKMMKEMEQSFNQRFNEHDFEYIEQSLARVDIERLMADAERSQNEILREAAEQARQAAAITKEHMEEWREQNQHHLEEIEHQRLLQAERLQEVEEQMRHMEADMKAFEKELKEALVQDGYIGKDEEINNIHWDDDGEIEVNGKKIKEAHRKKYNEMHRKHFKKGGDFHYVE